MKSKVFGTRVTVLFHDFHLEKIFCGILFLQEQDATAANHRYVYPMDVRRSLAGLYSLFLMKLGGWWTKDSQAKMKTTTTTF